MTYVAYNWFGLFDDEVTATNYDDHAFGLSYGVYTNWSTNMFVGTNSYFVSTNHLGNMLKFPNWCDEPVDAGTGTERGGTTRGVTIFGVNSVYKWNFAYCTNDVPIKP